MVTGLIPGLVGMFEGKLWDRWMKGERVRHIQDESEIKPRKNVQNAWKNANCNQSNTLIAGKMDGIFDTQSLESNIKLMKRLYFLLFLVL